LKEVFNTKRKTISKRKSPLKRGVVLLVRTQTPKKPNSALRKVERVSITMRAKKLRVSP